MFAPRRQDGVGLGHWSIGKAPSARVEATDAVDFAARPFVGPGRDRLDAIADGARRIGFEGDGKRLGIASVTGKRDQRRKERWSNFNTTVDPIKQCVADRDVTGTLRMRPHSENDAPRLIELAMVVIAARRARIFISVVPDGGKEVSGQLELNFLWNAVAVQINGTDILRSGR